MSIPDVLPLIAVRGQACFPSTGFALRVGRDRSVQALKEAGAQAGCVLLVAQREAAEDDPQPEDLHGTGTVAEVREIQTLPDLSLHVTLQNRGRARIQEYVQTAPFYRVRVEILAHPPGQSEELPETDALVHSIRTAFHQIAMASGNVPSEALSEVLGTDDPGPLAERIAAYLPLPAAIQQGLLEMPSGRERLEHLYPLLSDPETMRAGLVEALGARHTLPTAACRRALLRVPRHLFVPSVPLAAAYLDVAISTHTAEEQGREVGISSISAPTIVATNIGQLRLRPGLRVLEIGAGTGYNAAILAEIVGPENVTSIDLDPEIVAEARAHLDATGYRRVFVDVADGWDGYPARAPYDRIILTVGVHDLAPAWLAQLREGGILVVWLSFRCIQFTVSFRKRNDILVSERISFVWSLDLRGKHPRRMTHHYGDRLTLWHDGLDDEDLGVLDDILNGSAVPFSIPEFGPEWNEFCAFLALSHPQAVALYDARLRPHGIDVTAWGVADLQNRHLAVALGGANVRFGGPEIGEEFRRLAREWLALGRPGLDRLVLAAYPRTAYPSADCLPPGRWMGLVEKEHAWFRWRYRRSARGASQP